MFIEQTIKFEFRGLVPLGRLCIPATGYFYDKTKISKKNLRADYYQEKNSSCCTVFLYIFCFCVCV